MAALKLAGQGEDEGGMGGDREDPAQAKGTEHKGFLDNEEGKSPFLSEERLQSHKCPQIKCESRWQGFIFLYRFFFSTR